MPVFIFSSVNYKALDILLTLSQEASPPYSVGGLKHANIVLSSVNFFSYILFSSFLSNALLPEITATPLTHIVHYAIFFGPANRLSIFMMFYYPIILSRNGGI